MVYEPMLIRYGSDILPPFATHILNCLDMRIHQEVASKIYHTYTKNRVNRD